MITLTSPGITVGLHPLGARIASCVVDGVETCFGTGSENSLATGDLYSGVICGRHAGRVTSAQFPLDGAIVKLVPNAGPHQLHGGPSGFHARRWDWLRDGNRVTFSLQSNDGDQGFPGDLAVTGAYELKGNTLSLKIAARTGKPTLCNITNHAYWNMAGGGTVLDQELQIMGDQHFPLNDLLLPLGRIEPTAGTPHDFRSLRRIDSDHDFCTKLEGKRGEMKHGLTLRDPASGRQLDVWTTEGCMQSYTAIHWEPSLIGHTGPLQRSGALAIEPQNVADAPNHPAFPSSILRPGEVYRNAMEWRFS
ncbi:MAG: aldose epimerase family protein [Hyphomicrobiales bacterium]